MSHQDKGRGAGPRDYTGSDEAGGYPRTGAGSGGMYLPQGRGGSRYGAESEGARQTAFYMEDPSQLRARTRMPRGYRRSDERVREDICERLAADGRIDPTDVSVEVRGGRVVLEGTVPERRMKYVIEDIAAACLRANDVENRITVARNARAGGDTGQRDVVTDSPGP
jgi:osmotically-inducible protein OsmY